MEEMKEQQSQEVSPEIDVKKIEQDLIEEEQKRLDSLTSHLDQHAFMYQAYIPRVEILLNKMGKKGLIRLIKYLIKFPIEETTALKDKGEKEVFQITNQLMTSKYAMVFATIWEEQAKQENNDVNSDESQKGDENGQ